MTRVEVGTGGLTARARERPRRRFADWSMTALACVLVRVFFRSIEIDGGFVTMRVLERVRRIGGVVEGYRIVTARPNIVGPVLAHRAAVVRDARAILPQQ